MTSHFTFLSAEWTALNEAAVKVEAAVHPGPRRACFCARRALAGRDSADTGAGTEKAAVADQADR